MIWRESYRADKPARMLADRHYNRQSPGAAQFVPTGRCIVLFGAGCRAVWVTSWPDARYVKHAWAGAWVNTLFRREGGPQASAMILDAVAATRWRWPDAPEAGLVTFVDPQRVKATKVRGKDVFGWCYRRAGFEHVGFTQGGLWAWLMRPERMPPAAPAYGMQPGLIAGA